MEKRKLVVERKAELEKLRSTHREPTEVELAMADPSFSALADAERTRNEFRENRRASLKEKELLLPRLYRIKYLNANGSNGVPVYIGAFSFEVAIERFRFTHPVTLRILSVKDIGAYHG